MKKLLYLFLFTFYISSAFAQPYKTIKKYKPYDWMVGVSWSVVEDDGSPFSGIFNVASSWNYLFYPTRISVDRYLKSGWSLEAVFTYNTYSSKKNVNGKLDASGIFLSGDINSKYSFTNLYVPKLKWFDPYVNMGLGYTFRAGANTSIHTPTLNLGIGMNFWIYKGFGIQLHSNAKLGVAMPLIKTSTNYLQHSAGIVYRWKKGGRSKNPSDKKRYKWTKDNQRHKPNKGH